MRASGVVFILTIFLLGVMAGCGAGMAWAEQPARPNFNAEADYAWAAKWAAQVQKNRRHAITHARCLGVKLPAKLRVVTECPVQIGDELEQLPWLYDWASYGHEWKRQAIALARYCRKTWQRMTHPRGSGAERWLPLCWHEGWPRSQRATMVKVIWRESNGKPWVVGPGPYYGLFQLWSGHNSGGWDLCDPVVNVRLALQLWKRRGWQPWSQTAW